MTYLFDWPFAGLLRLIWQYGGFANQIADGNR
jgi:hypothetical protein